MFQDCFDYDKNFVYKNCYFQEKVFVNVNNLKIKNLHQLSKKLKLIIIIKNIKLIYLEINIQ